MNHSRKWTIGWGDRQGWVAAGVALALVGLLGALVWIKAPARLLADEPGYLAIAQQLLQGAGDGVAWWGPGYPIILVPFLAFDVPLMLARLLNAVFLTGAILYTAAAVTRIGGSRRGWLTGLALALYPPYYFYVHMLISEKFALFLVSAGVYHYLQARSGSRRRLWHLAACAGFLAWLCLTKIFFGYVVLTCLFLALVAFLARRRGLLVPAGVCLLALALCLPFLVSNYRYTGKPFYWATSGGLSLYCLSSPYAGESGSWFGRSEMREKPSLAQNHGAFLNSLEGLSAVDRDVALKQAAWRQIRSHPWKFARNWVCNISRLLFDAPYTHKPTTLKVLRVAIPNSVLILGLVVSLMHLRSRRSRLAPGLLDVGVFCSVAFVGSSFLSAYERMFTVLVPGLAVWVATTAWPPRAARTVPGAPTQDRPSPLAG